MSQERVCTCLAVMQRRSQPFPAMQAAQSDEEEDNDQAEEEEQEEEDEEEEEEEVEQVRKKYLLRERRPTQQANLYQPSFGGRGTRQALLHPCDLLTDNSCPTPLYTDAYGSKCHAEACAMALPV